MPPGWASGRALAVHPAARGNGAARALLATGERLARQAGAAVLAFHTMSFMTGAIALYDYDLIAQVAGQPMRRLLDPDHA